MGRIAAKYIFTLDGFNPLKEAYVEYDADGTVTEIGECADFDHEENIFDGVLVPGFVNTHCHVELSHLKGKFAKGSGMAGFIDQINSLRDCVPAEEKRELLQKEMDSMWKAGVSAMADISNGSDSFRAKADSKIYTRTFIEVFGTEPEDCAGVIASAKELCSQAEALGLDASVTPHSCYTTCPELLSAASAEGLAKGFLSYHSQESPQEEEFIRYNRGELYENRLALGLRVPPATGRSSLEYFIDRLLAATGPGTTTAGQAGKEQCGQTAGHVAEGRCGEIAGHVLLVHNVCLTREVAEKALKVLKNAYWVLCPLSNIFIHRSLPTVRMMRGLGLNLCVGTDSLSSNDSLDMVGELFCLQENFPEIPLGELLSWSCLGGARFLGKESELGRLAPGLRPGIVGIANVTPDVRLTAQSRSVRLI